MVVPFAAIPGSAVGALAAHFDVVLGYMQASVPSLTITNTTDASRNPAFRSGDSWRLALSSAAAQSRVYLHLWRDGTDLGISGPYGPATDNGGAWSLTGSFGAQDAGSWQLQAVVGAANSSSTSSRLAITIAS